MASEDEVICSCGTRHDVYGRPAQTEFRCDHCGSMLLVPIGYPEPVSHAGTKYHVEFSLPDASIYPGAGKDPRYTYDTFEKAKAVAIEDLKHWRDKIDANLDELRRARGIKDLSYNRELDD